MEAARYEAFRLILSSATMYPVDQERASIALRGATADERPEVVRMILDGRAAWLDYLARGQRRWQRETRRPSRARHHDSIAIREGYVRCGR